jgi:hypothetical protein
LLKGLTARQFWRGLLHILRPSARKVLALRGLSSEEC